MRVGLQLPSFTWPGAPQTIRPNLAEIAARAEAAGFSSLWVMDHFFQLPPDTGLGGPDAPMLEAYTTLGYLAGITRKIQLGALVTGVIYRFPAILVKTVTTLDVLAGGRTYFGIGAGWYEREAVGLGVPYPKRPQRFELLEDTLRLARQMWSGDRIPFQGTHVRAPEPILNPMPVSSPHPRIMIGGNGEQRTLRLVARYADACNILVPDPGVSRRKLEVLRRHCQEAGRAYETIEKTSLLEVDLRGGPGAIRTVMDRLKQQGEAGIEHVIVNLPNAHEAYPLEAFEREIIPALAGDARVRAAL
jgi:F420-dependent oxidoreductase-like protein